VTCDAVPNAEVDAINARVHAHLVQSGAVEAGSVRQIRQRGRSLAVGVGTVLRVVDPTGPRTPAADRLHRSQRATVEATAGARMRLRMDDGTTRALTPAAVLKHFSYGYAGTVHKVQGQTSAVHVSALSPVKDAASMYVSASRARLGVHFVADATEFLTDAELLNTRTWGKGQFDDAVIDRIETTLQGRPERLDSAAASMLPRQPTQPAQPWQPTHSRQPRQQQPTHSRQPRQQQPEHRPYDYGSAGYSPTPRPGMGMSW
jgi:hypothetical protein